MENSITSMSKALSSGDKMVDSPEESGWTNYLVDFLCNNDIEQNSNSFSNSGHESPSLVSDAASSVAAMAKKLSDNDQAAAGGFSLNRSCKKLSFKKRRSTKAAIVVDEALEDTASSPVNSPKICYLNETDSMNRKEKDYTEISEEKGGHATASRINETRT